MDMVLMVIAVVKNENKLLLRKMDPSTSPYKELWGLFGGRIGDGESVSEALNKELTARWHFSVLPTEKLWWDEEVKTDHDGKQKRFIYIDALCTLVDGEPRSTNQSEKFEWVEISALASFDLNPPTKLLFHKLGYLH